MSEKWTTDNIPDLTGKVVIVTGANVGLGYETTKEIARKGATTIMACRNMDKAEAAKTSLQQEIPDAPLHIMQLDLASLQSVRDFAEAFQQGYERLDLLINNAGIMMPPYGTTVDGFEQQLGVNHLGHFALTGLLLDLLLKTPVARVVNVSSNAHKTGNIEFTNLMYEGGKGYSAGGAYGRSKLANLLFTYELQRLFEAHNADVIAVAAHPGGSNSDLGRYMVENPVVRFIMPVFQAIMQSAAMGALPTLRAAVDHSVKGGEYYGPDGFIELRGYPVIVKSTKASHNREDAKRLWQISEELTGVTYPVS